MLPAIGLAMLTSVPFWLVVGAWAIPGIGFLFVQFTMLGEISRVHRERHRG
jgi:hypothetical protein